MGNLNKVLVVLFLVLIIVMTLPNSFYPPNNEFREAVKESLSVEDLEDKIFEATWKKMVHWITFFESLDGWGKSIVGTGTATVDNTQVELRTSANVNDSVTLYKQPANNALITFSQKSRFRTRIQLPSVASQTIYITIGNVQGGSQGYGFKIVNNTLKGVTHDGTTENTVDLQTLAINTEYTLEARYEPNVGVTFWADDEPKLIAEKGKSTSNLPSAERVTNDLFIYYYIRTDTAAAKTLRFSFFEYLQKRDVLK